MLSETAALCDGLPNLVMGLDSDFGFGAEERAHIAMVSLPVLLDSRPCLCELGSCGLTACGGVGHVARRSRHVSLHRILHGVLLRQVHDLVLAGRVEVLRQVGLRELSGALVLAGLDAAQG